MRRSILQPVIDSADGRWIGNAGIHPDGRLNYSVKSAGKVRTFQQPIYCDSLLSKEFLYVAMPNSYRVVRARDVFKNRGSLRKASIDKDAKEPWYSWEPSAENLRILLSLPMVDEDSRRRAMKDVFFWKTNLPMVCYWSILLKAGSIPRDEGVGRLPAVSKTKIVKKKKVLTRDEMLAVMAGASVDTEVDTQVVESSVWKDAMKFQKYCPHYQLYSQQLIGAWAISQLKRVPLWYDMRVGKTWSAIAAYKHARANDEVDMLIVVCPTFNMYDPWLDELKSGNLSVSIMDGTAEEDMETVESAARGDVDVLIVNYERVDRRLEAIEDNLDMARLFIVADETSAIKNPESKRSLAMHRLCQKPLYVVLLNGTPCEQGPQDLWSQMRCIDSKGVVWGQTFADYASEWLYQYAAGKYTPKNSLDFQVFLSRTSIRYIRSEADQFAGRDKTFRYVELPPTKEQLVQSQNVLQGFLETVSASGDKKKQGVFDSYIVIAGFLREICCSYDKYREVEDGPYIRVRHEIDPKLLWVLAFIMSKPGEPVVIYCEFNEQESRLKEMLDEHKIPWSSTRPRMTPVVRNRLVEDVPFTRVQDWVKKFHSKFQVTGMPLPPPGSTDVKVPNWLRYDEEVISYERATHGPAALTEEHTTYKDRGTYPPHIKSDQVKMFNKGEAQVFICKWSQARGFSLARKEAVKSGFGTYPTIISLAPTWSLGSWQQGQDRCVTTHSNADGSTSAVNTMVYALTTKGSIEGDIMAALRNKSSVATTLFQDAKRKGFESFVSNMLSDMKAASMDKTSVFDAEEMNARITLGVPPFSKLSRKLVLNKAASKYKVKGGYKATEKYLSSLPSNHKASLAWAILQTKY